MSQPDGSMNLVWIRPMRPSPIRLLALAAFESWLAAGSLEACQWSLDRSIAMAVAIAIACCLAEQNESNQWHGGRQTCTYSICASIVSMLPFAAQAGYLAAYLGLLTRRNGFQVRRHTHAHISLWPPAPLQCYGNHPSNPRAIAPILVRCVSNQAVSLWRRRRHWVASAALI